MLFLTYAKACNLLLKRWFTNLLTNENQMGTMKNTHHKTHQGMKTKLDLCIGIKEETRVEGQNNRDGNKAKSKDQVGEKKKKEDKEILTDKVPKQRSKAS